jgi:hypothetical protein
MVLCTAVTAAEPELTLAGARLFNPPPFVGQAYNFY